MTTKKSESSIAHVVDEHEVVHLGRIFLQFGRAKKIRSVVVTTGCRPNSPSGWFAHLDAVGLDYFRSLANIPQILHGGMLLMQWHPLFLDPPPVTCVPCLVNASRNPWI